MFEVSRFLPRPPKAKRHAVKAMAVLRSSVLMDPIWYKENHTDLHGTPVDAVLHYFETGAREGRNPGPIFDTKFYLARNPDVVASGMNPLVHYILHGAKEGRDPHPPFANDVQSSPMPEARAAANSQNLAADVPISAAPELRTANGFDAVAYAVHYPDVRAHMGDNPERLLKHWQTFGWKEGRAPFGYLPYKTRSAGPAFWDRQDAITFYGFFEAHSGLGSAARGYRAALLKAGYTVFSVTISEKDRRFETSPDVRTGSAEIDISKRNKVNIFFLNADMVHRFFWDQRLHLLDDSFNIGIWAWELAHFRPDWASAFGAFDEIWVLSEFCRASVASLSPVPVVAMPIAVEIERNNDLLPRGYFRVPDDAFVFGCIFDVGSVVERKNPDMAIRAFIEAFGNRDDVLLVVKYHSSHHYPDEVKKLHSLAAGQANIRFFGRVFDEEEIMSFKSMIDCIVSPHRSEGFGLNIAEALLLGKIVIATNYSGNLDFMDEQNSYPVAYRLVELEKLHGPYPAEALWAEPDFDDLVDKMRVVVAERSEAFARAKRGKLRLLEEFNSEAIGTRFKQRLDELGIFNAGKEFLKSWRAGVDFTYRPVKADGPKISVVVPVYDIEPAMLAKCITSVTKQSYQNWELILHDDGSTRSDTIAELVKHKGSDPRIKVSLGTKNQGIAEATNTAIGFSSGVFIAFLDNDDELAPAALGEMAAAIQNNADADLFYSDEDKIDFDGSLCDHYFKPDWSPEHLESVMYLLHLLVVRRALLLSIGGLRARFSGAQDYDLALRVSRVARRIVHVPKILYHWRKIPGSASAQVDAKPYGLQRGAEALQDYLDAGGREAVVVPGLLPGLFRVRDVIPAGLPVTLTIFTDNRSAEIPGRGTINLFDHFVTGILANTKTACEMHILAVDNGNLSAPQRDLVERSGGKVISYDGPRSPFNFSKKANFALRHVKTELVVLLNDDMEVASADWLDALVELAQRRTTGVVGARLLYPDERIQHCGVVLGINDHVAHIYHQSPAHQIGYNGYTHLIRNYLAVTGACMATRMSLFDEVGGFDEELAIDYNDIDFCLRAHSAGYRNIYTPFAQLYHFEGTTAVRSSSNEKEHDLFVRRWSHYMDRDPFYNVNLTRSSLDFSEMM